MPKDPTYNGWTNYATWRVNLEIVDDLVNHSPEEYRERFLERPTTYQLAAYLQNEVEELLFEDQPSEHNLVADYARAFLADVDWYAIAEHVLADWPEE